MQESDRGDSYSREGGRTRGQEMRVDATGGKMKERKDMRVDVTKRTLIARMMTGRKEAGKKGTTQKAARAAKSQQPGRCQSEEQL